MHSFLPATYKDRLLLFSCLMAALLLWIPLKLSKNYQHNLAIPIHFIPPTGQTFSSLAPTIWPLNLSGSGYDMLKLSKKLINDTLVLNIPDNNFQQNYKLTKSEFISAIYKQHKIKNVEFNSTLDEIVLSLDSLLQKEIPVQASIQYQFDPAFGPSKQLKIEPATITISGPAKAVNLIQNIQTDNRDFGQIAQSILSTVALINPIKSVLHLSDQTVDLSLPVSKLTEKNLIVSIADLNEDKSLSLYPDKILLTVMVPLDMYNSVDESNVKISLEGIGNNTSSVQIDQMPPFTKYQMHSPKIVRYLKPLNDSLLIPLESIIEN